MRLRWCTVPAVRRVVLAAIFVCGLIVYTITLNTDVQAADSGELQIAGWLLGVPHPPGYPLYTMLNWLVAHVPVANPYARMSFLSALFAAGTLTLIGDAVIGPHEAHAFGAGARGDRPNGAILAAVASAAILATSTTFWAQATTVNVRSLTALCTAALLWVFLRERPNPIAFVLVLGLALGHHASLAFVGIWLGLIVLVRWFREGGRDSQPRAHRIWLRELALAVLAGIATQVVWLYLPIRDAAGARFAPGSLGTVDGLLFHIFARGFAGDLFAFATPALLWDRLALLPGLLQFQFGYPLLFAMAPAALILLFRRPVQALGLLGAAVVHLFVSLTYRAPQTVEYALPAWIILATVLGLGLRELLVWNGASRGVQIAGPVLAGLALGVACLNGVARYPSFAELASWHDTRQAAHGVLENAAPGGNVLAQWNEATPMWALQDIEGFRRDVTVTYVPPAGAQAYEDTFAERAGEAVTNGQGVYATSFFAEAFATHGLCAIPQNGLPAWELFPCPVTSPRQAGTIFDGRILVLSVKLAEKAYLDCTVDVILTVVARGPIIDGDSVTVRIMLPDGRVGTNVDFRLDPRLKPGQVQSVRKQMALPSSRLSGGEVQIVVGAYNGDRQFINAGGGSTSPFAKLELGPSKPVLIPANATRFGDAMALVGVHAWREGARVVVDLDWRALRPLDVNYKVSVRLDGEGLYLGHDSEPALGAIPTLKWIAWSEVLDRHVFDVGANRSSLRGTVVVYNGNDRVVLPIMPGHAEDTEDQPMFTVDP